MPGKLSKEEQAARKVENATKFIEIASRRVTVVLKGLNALSKCANPRAYTYTKEQIAKQNAAIDAAVARCKAAFEKSEAPVEEGGFTY
jgi:hypothetical protein